MLPTMLGLFLSGAAIAISPIYAAWLAPATIGLIFSAPIIHLTSRQGAGRLGARFGGLVTPVSVSEPACYFRAKQLRASFTNLQPDRLQSLLVDRDRQLARHALVDPHWPLARNEVHVPLAMARARAERAASIYELTSFLSRAETMALLNSNRDLHAISFRFSAPGTRRNPGKAAATPRSAVPGDAVRSAIPLDKQP